MPITSRFAAIFLLLAPAAFAARWTPDDVLFAERAAQFDIAPDARSAVWVKSQMDKEKGTLVGNLFLSGLTGHRVGFQRQLFSDKSLYEYLGCFASLCFGEQHRRIETIRGVLQLPANPHPHAIKGLQPPLHFWETNL